MSGRMNWDRVRRERNLFTRRHYSDGELVAMVPARRQQRTQRSVPVCPVCTLTHPGEC